MPLGCDATVFHSGRLIRYSNNASWAWSSRALICSCSQATWHGVLCQKFCRVMSPPAATSASMTATSPLFAAA